MDKEIQEISYKVPLKSSSNKEHFNSLSSAKDTSLNDDEIYTLSTSLNSRKLEILKDLVIKIDFLI